MICSHFDFDGAIHDHDHEGKDNPSAQALEIIGRPYLGQLSAASEAELGTGTCTEAGPFYPWPWYRNRNYAVAT
jgi:hypothetical protein